MSAADLWPWLTLAGMGALHGLNPGSGWMLAAAWGLHSGDRRQVIKALWPIGVGHAASLGLTVALVLGGTKLDRTTLQVLAAVLLAVSVALHAWRRAPCTARRPAGQAGLVLGAFLGSSFHGAGLMLVPALMPMCFGMAGQGGEMGRLVGALAAVAVHGVAMLAATGLVAAGVCGGLGSLIPQLRKCPPGNSRRPARKLGAKAASIP
ncbi:hypothetical protein [Variovorax sp. OV329]|uniref:hypothetical protein n=1 Tax=Variovorax sp. OV329 TaxID=1882825 RepID=UPI0008F3A55E|nr:hypothetical protein [Variovorax sp. OV329]SFL89006.1 hypothetical protein SAMN05444747_101149 [Variovorax sp. OV329]